MLVAPSLDAEAGVEKFKAKHKIEEYALVAGARNTAKAYGVKGYPTAFIVGKDGKILSQGHPASAAFIKQIEAALAK